VITGVDVSGHQDDWHPTTEQFAFVKATEGTWFVSDQHERQIRESRAKGLHVGHYHWLTGSVDPIQQARFFIAKANPQPGDSLWCDFEDDWRNPKKYRHPTPAERWAFREECKRLKPYLREGLYCNRSAWTGTAVKAGDGLWIAAPDVSSSDLDQYPWLIHQYDWTPIDRNRAKFDTLLAMKAWARELEPKEDDLAAKVAFRGGWTCSCVATSLPWVEADMIRRGIIRFNIDIAQLGWRTSTEASKGTHAEGGCVDTWGQWNTEAIDVWRRWGWTMQRRDLRNINTHAHGWPYGCPHLSEAAQQQARDWDRRDAGLQGTATVVGRWPVKHWKHALEEGIMSMIDDIADAVAKRRMTLTAADRKAIATDMIRQLLHTDNLDSPTAWQRNHPQDTTWPGLQFWRYTHDAVYRTEGRVNTLAAQVAELAKLVRPDDEPPLTDPATPDQP
jgi:hypothetical protein